MIAEHVEELAALYSLGLLEGVEAAQFEEMLNSDPELRALVRELQDSAAALASAASPQNAPREVRMRLVAEIRSEKESSHASSSAARWWPWSIAAVFAIIAASLAVERVRLQSELAALRQKDEASQNEIAALQQQDAISKLRIATLSGTTENAPGSVGSVAWDGEKQRGVLTLEKLPPPGPAQDYQLWVIDPQYAQPVSGGLVHVDDKGNARLIFTVDVPIHAAEKFALSRERKGGASTAQGPIVMLGQ